MNLSLMPDYIYQQFAANGKMLSGGTIYFYQSGTFTPQSVFADAAGTTPLGTSVTLSASGTAVIFLGPGAYRIWVKDANGVQVAPYVDGILGTAQSGLIGSNSTFGAYKIYSDVRALTIGPDFIYVTGGTAEGDGGAGWFQLQPSSSLVDDGGTILTAASGSLVYKRVFDGYLDPQWYGVVLAYNVDQTARLNVALAASAALGFPLFIPKALFIAQSVTVPTGASVVTGREGYFSSTYTINLTFPVGTYFDGEGVSFGGTIQPVFAAGVCEQIKLSWMGASSDEARWAKLGASATVEYKALADVPTSIASDPSVPANFELDFAAGGKVTITAITPMTLTIGRLAYQGIREIFHFQSIYGCGVTSFGGVAAMPEWFGAVGDGAADDSMGVWAASKSGRMALMAGRTYKYGTVAGTMPSPLEISGEGTLYLQTGRTMGTGALSLDRCTITMQTPGAWFAGTLLEASDAAFPSTYTATTKIVSGCVYTDDSLAPMFDGSPALKNAHLPLLPSAQFLGTDSSAKIIAVPNDPLRVNNFRLNTLFADSLAAITGFGSVYLTEPINMILMINNTLIFDLYIPNLTSVVGSNLVLLIPKSTATVTLHGTINYNGTLVSTILFNKPVILYFDMYTHTWYTVSLS